jgi:hypothetical protein
MKIVNANQKIPITKTSVQRIFDAAPTFPTLGQRITPAPNGLARTAPNPLTVEQRVTALENAHTSLFARVAKHIANL